MNPEIKLLVGSISSRDWHPQFGTSLVRFANHLRLNGINGKPVGLAFAHLTQCSNMCFSRQRIVTDAMEKGFTHVLYLDDDTIFPADAADRLFAHDLPFVGVNICKKNQTAFVPTASDIDSKPLTSEGKTGLEEVVATTMHLFLSRVEELKTVAKPYFMLSGDYAATDDIYYMSKIRFAGHKIFIDHDLSKEVGHIGSYIYTFPGSDFYNTVNGKTPSTTEN